jgi:hypothetical protein
MNQRRTDEDTGMTIEYAWFLADTRGVGFALRYLDDCHVPRALVTRALDHPELRRTHERRAVARPCDCKDTCDRAGNGASNDAVHGRDRSALN